MAVSVAVGYFRMVSGSLSTLCPADTAGGRWVSAYLPSAVDSGNVPDECVFDCQGAFGVSCPSLGRSREAAKYKAWAKNFSYNLRSISWVSPKNKKRPSYRIVTESQSQENTGQVGINFAVILQTESKAPGSADLPP